MAVDPGFPGRGGGSSHGSGNVLSNDINRRIDITAKDPTDIRLDVFLKAFGALYSTLIDKDKVLQVNEGIVTGLTIRKIEKGFEISAAIRNGTDIYISSDWYTVDIGDKKTITFVPPLVEEGEVSKADKYFFTCHTASTFQL